MVLLPPACSYPTPSPLRGPPSSRCSFFCRPSPCLQFDDLAVFLLTLCVLHSRCGPPLKVLIRAVRRWLDLVCLTFVGSFGFPRSIYLFLSLSSGFFRFCPAHIFLPPPNAFPTGPPPHPLHCARRPNFFFFGVVPPFPSRASLPVSSVASSSFPQCPSHTVLARVDTSRETDSW